MYPAIKTCKAIATAICLLMSLCSYSQSASIDYFEVSGMPVGDSSSTELTLIVAIANPQYSDSVSFSVSNTEGSTVYASGNTLLGWKSNYPYRVEASMLYLSIPVGAYASSGSYNATLSMKDANGAVLTMSKP